MTFLTHLEDSTIQRLVEGALDEAEATAAKRHIEDCSRCRRRSGEVSAIFTALSAPFSLPEPPADFLALVMARVDLEPGLVVEPIRIRAVVTSVAAGAAMAVAGGLLVTSGGGAILPTAEIATGLATLLGKAGLLGAIAKGGAPIAAAIAVATGAVLTPFLVRALRAVQPSPVRATLRSL